MLRGETGGGFGSKTVSVGLSSAQVLAGKLAHLRRVFITTFALRLRMKTGPKVVAALIRKPSGHKP